MFPNPANYYLQTPEEFEKEITDLDFAELAQLNLELARSLEINRTEAFESLFMGDKFDIWIAHIKDGEFIALMQFIVERIAYLHHQKRLQAPCNTSAAVLST